jgi:hypothetical protein
LSRLGKFRLSGKLVAHRRDMVTEGKRKRRLNWSLWEHGFMTLQEPDESGMAYVLSYCLKDQFTAEKSQGTMREAKAENFATGLFRMSKRPAIGEAWLVQKMETLLASGSVLPSLQLKIPEMGGYYVPSGTFRKKLLWYLVAVNRRVLWATGANAPQWSTLLASLADMPTDQELLNGERFQQEKEDDDTADSLARRARIDSGEVARRQTVSTCGRGVPCLACLNSASESQLSAQGFGRYTNEGGFWEYYSLEGWPSLSDRRAILSGENPLCQRSGSKANRLAFPRTGGAAP